MSEEAPKVRSPPEPSVPENVCGESWQLVGNSCLKFITANDSYDNSKLACRSHNAVLASLTTQKKVDFVLKELQAVSRMVTASSLIPLFHPSREPPDAADVHSLKPPTMRSLV